MAGISAIYILDKKGRVLISRHFRPDLPSNIYDIFNKKILEYDEYTLKYISLQLDPLSRTRTITFSISISIMILTLWPSLKKITTQFWYLHFSSLLSKSSKVTLKTFKKSPSVIILLLSTSC